MKALLWLFGGACLFLVFGFHQGRSANPNSRLLTVYGVVEEHHIYADRWLPFSSDNAQIGGHVYSDKAPLSSFVVLPFYWALRRVEGGPQRPRDEDLANDLGILLCSALPFAIFAVLLLRRGLSSGGTPRAAVWLTLGAAFGTCLASYGGIYYGHLLAGLLFLGSYILACEREERFALAGALGGLAVLAEYPLAIPQALIFGYLLLGKDRRPRALRFALGGLPFAFLMLAWNRAVTGAWLDFPYNHVTDRWAPMKIAFGMRLPDPRALVQLLFGQYRGLAFYAPVLLLLLPALFLQPAKMARRQRLALAIMAANLLFVSAYFKWDGGWCTGPRHLTPLIMLALYEGLGAFAAMKRGRILFALLAASGVVLILCANAVDALPPDTMANPAFALFFPRALRGGELGGKSFFRTLGLRDGHAMLALWSAIFVVTGAIFSRAFSQLEQRASGDSDRAPRPSAATDETLAPVSVSSRRR